MTDDQTTDTTPTDPAGKTHVLLAVDRSSSMMNLEAEVRAGFNAFLDDLAGKDNADAFTVTVLLFDHEWHTLCVAAPLADVPRLDKDNYRVRGYTALYDAVGNLIVDFERTTVLNPGDKVLLVVQTDGCENASREFASDTVKELIAAREAGGRWTTLYLGAGPAAWDGGALLGMRSVNTTADASGTRSAYSGIAMAASAYSRGASRAETQQVLATEALGEPQAGGK